MASLDEILGGATGLFGIASGLFGSKKPKGMNELLGLERERNEFAREDRAKRNKSARLAEILNAMTLNQRSPLFKRLASEEEGAIRSDLIGAINQGMKQRKRYGNRYIQSDRDDENRWRSLTQGFANAKMQARNAARSYLANAAGRQLNVAGAYSGWQPSTAGFQTAVQSSMGDRDRRRGDILTGVGMFADLARPRARSTDAIDWNRAYGYGSGSPY